MATLYALGTAAIVGVFVYEIVHRHQVRTGLLLIALLAGSAAYGLWRQRTWGRGLGLFVALANCGLGAIQLMAAFPAHRGKVVPVVLLAASMAVGYVLGKPIFS